MGPLVLEELLSQQPKAVLIAGMHRSGTSMVGGILAELGIDMGRRLIPADAANARGYFEDADIVDFHGQAFRSLMPPEALGHVDWGWSESAALDSNRLADYRSQARSLVAERASKGGVWGFKDPRTTVALDFWDECIEDARYVLVYRYPWEVADSMQRGGAEVFLKSPTYAYRIWAFYNARLLDFYERNKSRCLLVSSNALPFQFESFVRLIGTKLGVELGQGDPEKAFQADLFTRGEQDEVLAGLTAAAFPECSELLGRLDDLADLPSDGAWRRGTARQTELGRPDVPAEIDLSIIVPTYNDGCYLIDALASIERCQFPRTELIVVNDGSSDPTTLRTLAGLESQGYYVVHKTNGGLSAARNTAIAASRGRYVLPLDADNKIRPDYVRAAVELLDREPNAGVVYGDRQLFGSSKELVLVPEYDIPNLLGGNTIDACAVYRRDLWQQLGGYDENMRGFEDWEFWIRAGLDGWNFRHLSIVAQDYRVRADSLLDQCLEREHLHRLCGYVRKKHADIFHSHIHWLWRGCSGILGLFTGPSRLHGLRELESRSFWAVFWFLFGSGGVLAKDRTRRRIGRRLPGLRSMSRS